MLTSVQNVEDLVEGLEVRFLANRDDNLRFALATDLRDASEETIPEDEPLLRLAQERIEGLNKKYADAKKRYILSVSSPAAMECAGKKSGWVTSEREASLRI